MQTETRMGYFLFITALPDNLQNKIKNHLNSFFFSFMETRLNTVYYLFYYKKKLHRIHVHIYLSGPILNGSFLQNIGDAEHIISPVCRI